MVEILDSTTERCVVARFEGKITGDEYRPFLEAVDKRLKANDDVSVVAELSEFEFYGDFEAFKEDFHFGAREYRKLKRCAFVGDPKWIQLLAKLIKPFYKAEEKHFDEGRMKEAIAWASGK